MCSKAISCKSTTPALNSVFVARLTINCEGQKADECGGIVVNRTNPRVFLDNLEFRYLLLQCCLGNVPLVSMRSPTTQNLLPAMHDRYTSCN